MAQHSNTLIFILLFHLIHFSSSQHFNFTHNGFNGSNLDLQGATLVRPTGALALTNQAPNIIGHAFYPTPIPMFNITTGPTSFTTCFVFQIHHSGPNRGGYGFGFTISPSPNFPNAASGHYLGVFNPQNDMNTSNHIFMVEFDTVNGYNEEMDRDGNHIGVNINGMASVYSQPAHYYLNNNSQASEELNFGSGDQIQAWIAYDSVTRRVNVTVSPISVPKPATPLISTVVDLWPVMEETMYVGFSASTGRRSSSSHFILGWSFGLNGTAEPLDISRLPFVPPERRSLPNSRTRTALIATFSVMLFILLATLATIIFYRRVMNYEVLEEWELDCPHRYKYRDLRTATKGFKSSEMIGSGGFGSVYKGVLPKNGAEVAVKKITSNNSLQGYREFAAEIESLGRLRHKHLVNLLGWCKHKNDLLLVYEYVPNGSLDSLLYNSESKTVLTWEQRYNIIKGVAAGLLYLHEEWEKVVIHRDVKSSNVLIDRDMNARLGDFGLARLYDHGKTSHTTNVVGTVGYIAPELTRIGKASTSSDVFAYGILLLEVACGRGPVVYEANMVLVDWVVECMQKGNLFQVVDAKLNAAYEVEEMELVLGLGLLCSHPKPEARPAMREVIKYLNGDEMLPVLEKLNSAGSRRIDEITSRLLSLGLINDDTAGTKTTSYSSSSVGQISSTSLDNGR